MSAGMIQHMLQYVLLKLLQPDAYRNSMQCVKVTLLPTSMLNHRIFMRVGCKCACLSFHHASMCVCVCVLVGGLMYCVWVCPP